MKIIKRHNSKRYKVKLRAHFYREYLVYGSSEEDAKKAAMWKFDHDPDNPCLKCNTDRKYAVIKEIPDDYERS